MFGDQCLLNVGVVGFKVLSHASFHHPSVLSSLSSLYPSFHPLGLCRTITVWSLFILIETPKARGSKGTIPLWDLRKVFQVAILRLAKQGRNGGGRERSKRNTTGKGPEEGKTCKLMSLLQPKTMQPALLPLFWRNWASKREKSPTICWSSHSVLSTAPGT